MYTLFLGAWRYRQFIRSSVRLDLTSRFTRSKLGGFWVVIHPLTQVLIYALVLSGVLSAKMPGINNRYAYAIYLCAGQVAWSLFAEVITRSLTVFIDNANLLKKISFPRITLPLILIGSALLNNLFLLTAVFVVFAVLGHMPGGAVACLPLLIVITLAFAVGLGLVLGVLNVFFRDLGQVVPIMLQILFWFTPIVYPATIIPEALREWLAFNPVYPLVAAYQEVLVYGRFPAPTPLLAVFAFSLLMLAFGLTLFRRASADMMDVL
ncbi:MAG: ABC transporter permease [Desulfurivibrionaceae bacterium]